MSNLIQVTEIFTLLECYAVQVDSYRRCGTTYRSHLQGPNEGQLTFRDKLSVPSSGAKWRSVTDVSGQPIGPIFRGQM